MSVEQFLERFDFEEEVDRVEIDFSRGNVWDATAVAAIDRVVLKFRERGTEVRVTGLNESSTAILDQLARHDEAGAALSAGH